MKERKYESYLLVADYGQVNEDYENYREAYSAYCKEVRYKHPATLYGRTYEGNITCIHTHAD